MDFRKQSDKAADQKVRSKTVPLREGRPVDGGTDSPRFEKRRECVPASVREGDAAIAAEGEVCEAVIDKVFRRKACDRVGIGHHAGKAGEIRCAEAVDDGACALRQRGRCAPVRDAADPSVERLSRLCRYAERINQREIPFGIPLCRFRDAADEVAPVCARPLRRDRYSLMPAHAVILP